MELFINQVLAGIATGAIYACMALAVVMIYQAIDHLNFAQGEMAMFSTFISWQLMQWGIPYWGAFVLTLALSFAVGIAIERVLFRPLAKAPILANVAWKVVPLKVYDNDQLGNDIVKWYQADPQLRVKYPRVMSSTPTVFYWLDFGYTDPDRAVQWSTDAVAAHAPGTILVWDWIYGMHNSNDRLVVSKETVAKSGWIFREHFTYGKESADVFLSPEDNSGQPTQLPPRLEAAP